MGTSLNFKNYEKEINPPPPPAPPPSPPPPGYAKSGTPIFMSDLPLESYNCSDKRCA